MSALTIVCDNCGAKYRLPETFTGDKAKCKQCSSVIDVAAQKAAADAPAKPTAPAAAASGRSSERASSRRAKATEKADAADKKPARASRRSRSSEPEEPAEPASSDARKRSDRRHNRAARAGSSDGKNNSMVLIGGGVGLLAIIAVIVVLSTGGGDEPKANDTASAPAEQTKKPEAPAVQPAQPKAEQPKTEEPATQDEPAMPGDSGAPTKDEATEAAAKTADAGAPKDAAKSRGAEDDDGEKKEKWEYNTTASLEDVYDPKQLGEMQWPEAVDDEKKEEIRSLVADIVDGGLPGIRAKPQLEEIGYYAVYGLIERLRLLDYKSSEQQMTAWELNKLLESITAGMNAGFVAVNAGEQLDPRKADHNAKTTKAWGTLLVQYPTKEQFDAWLKKRLSSK